jgi:Ca-activated chloride channel family protein
MRPDVQFDDEMISSHMTLGNGEALALQGVRITANVQGLMADIQVEQTYRHPEQAPTTKTRGNRNSRRHRATENMEVTYTFPLPLGAVLLSVTAELAGKPLTAVITEAKQAEHDYENAIDEGNSALMLQESSPGLYTMSLGNLLPGETAVICYRYAMLLSWQGDNLRLLLPTTLAPRYGNPADSGLQPHQIPASSLQVEYPLQIQVTITGDLANGEVTSPSHAIVAKREDDSICITLRDTAFMDRDFVLALEKREGQSTAICTTDGEAHVALAVFRIPKAIHKTEQPLNLKVLIDCSGSMAGSSIAQTRIAALRILKLLRPDDRFNITLFGTQHTHLFPSLQLANAEAIKNAQKILESLQADMGGTETGVALHSVFDLKGYDNTAAVLLLTDGQFWDDGRVIDHAISSEHQVFTVGVGTAVTESFLQEVAEKTGGACELVAPQEGMAERIVMQFDRMRQPKAIKVTVKWPSTPSWNSILPNAMYAGDTVHIFAGTASAMNGDVELTAQFADGSELTAKATLKSFDSPELPRIAAAERLKTAKEKVGLAMSLQYQLLSKWTRYVVVAEREDKAKEMPSLQTTPHMLPAGWGGVGSVMVVMDSAIAYRNKPRVSSCSESKMIFLDIRRPKPGETPLLLSNWLRSIPKSKWPKTYQELRDIALDKRVIEWLEISVEKTFGNGITEKMVVASFLRAMVNINKQASTVKRLLNRVAGMMTAQDDLESKIMEALQGMSDKSWPDAVLSLEGMST